MKTKDKNSKGFSLIELIIAVAILAILSGLLAPQLIRYVEKSREARDVQVIDAVYVAVNTALADENAYEDFMESAGSGGALSALADEAGMLLEDVMDGNGEFPEELKAILGSGEIRLKSKRASGKGGEAGKIRIRIDENGQTTVWAAGAESGDKEDFTIGW